MALLTEGFRNEFHGQGTIVPSLRSVRLSIGGAVGRTVVTLFVWLERARERRQLLALGDRALKDFGSTRADAITEGQRPFWRA